MLFILLCLVRPFHCSVLIAHGACYCLGRRQGYYRLQDWTFALFEILLSFSSVSVPRKPEDNRATTPTKTTLMELTTTTTTTVPLFELLKTIEVN